MGAISRSRVGAIRNGAFKNYPLTRKGDFMKYIQKIIFTMIILDLICAGCKPTYAPGIAKLQISPRVKLYTPRWSPNGAQITGVSGLSKYEYAMYIVELESGKARSLIDTYGTIAPEAWSPDGSRIAFSALGSDTFSNGIWIFNIKDSSTYSVGPGDAAAWSPDGKQLAIYSCAMGGRN
jgi:Tol biopolymer transport system component